ncbi:TIGR02281 family clan AA aspartic protease [Chelatococcus sambhunathii]|uniref:TIGR02281 family clan AA aspartic protease n=1 Tax=Chelatococcus sambhunathii TaxID=363953 RepID=A0ABU1DKY5_9HYPH|nr:TIGR02281 family clan AA aspartic protease [Chelatococcus sambhunathii]MDR4308792.1 TIGR02281 family clan AA aspartic protease [Chelatococcus sambhunathii]
MLKTVILASGVMLGAAYMAGDALRAGLTPGGAAPAHVAARAEPEETRPGNVSLRADPDGHFRVDASVGSRRVPMLVDTGATVVALSYENGQRLGVISASDRFDARVTTANGSVGAKRVVLRDVTIGSVRVTDVAAVVLAPGAMDGALLGMSFLGRLRKLETSRDRMVMER